MLVQSRRYTRVELSVEPARQEIPVARLADKERRAGAVWRRARLASAHGDEVRHGRDCGRREKDGLSCGVVNFAGSFRGSVTPAQKEAGAIGPASGSERICEVFTERRKLASADQRVAQYGSVPQTGVHCGSPVRPWLVGAEPAARCESNAIGKV